jgi:hypothetical protein
LGRLVAAAEAPFVLNHVGIAGLEPGAFERFEYDVTNARAFLSGMDLERGRQIRRRFEADFADFGSRQRGGGGGQAGRNDAMFKALARSDLTGKITWRGYRSPEHPKHVRIFHHKTGESCCSRRNMKVVSSTRNLRLI